MVVVELDASCPSQFRLTTLGQDILQDQLVQYTVKAGTWFGSYSDGNDSSQGNVSRLICPLIVR